jgi:RNA polymerase sigma-70 factor (ECF subfamily)
VIASDRSDEELVAAAQRGDAAAMDALLRRHYDRVHAVCRRIAGSTRDADDAAQEAMIRVVRNLDRFDGRSAFSTWVYRIATNTSLDELRKRRRRPQLHVVGDDEAPEPVDDVSHRTVDAVADRLAIDEALAQLPDDFRIPVVMRDVGDLDYAEIALELDIPVGTVKSRIARGRRMLVERLGNQDQPPGRPSDVPPEPSPPNSPPTPPSTSRPPPTPPPANS